MTTFWIALVATVVVGMGTYLTRASFIVLLADRELPPPVKSALGFVAPAVLAALVVSLLFGGERASVGWPEVAALAAGGLVGWRTRSLPWILVSGMTALWLMRWLA